MRRSIIYNLFTFLYFNHYGGKQLVQLRFKLITFFFESVFKMETKIEMLKLKELSTSRKQIEANHSIIIDYI